MIEPPPIDLMYDGPAEAYVSNGLEFLGHYKTLCNLQPAERMLDVGSGLGRKTIPLTEYLTNGSYEGIDCKELGIRWCQENITPKYPNFRFQHVDVQAPGYNPLGSISPLNFTFPFKDDEFDFVALASVFTHMHPGHILHYLLEINRVLKVNGRCLITWFIADKQTAVFPFWHTNGWLANKNFSLEAIAYTTKFVNDVYELADLTIKQAYKGNWSGSEGLSHQDMILATKDDR